MNRTILTEPAATLIDSIVVGLAVYFQTYWLAAAWVTSSLAIRLWHIESKFAPQVYVTQEKGWVAKAVEALEDMSKASEEVQRRHEARMKEEKLKKPFQYQKPEGHVYVAGELLVDEWKMAVDPAAPNGDRACILLTRKLPDGMQFYEISPHQLKDWVQRLASDVI